MPIKAEVHSDDFLYEVKFDATRWFEQATDDEILDLAKCDWGGDYPADVVAQFYDDQNRENIPVAELFRYVEKEHERTGEMGFECHVDETDAETWIREHRPQIQLPE